MELNSKKLNFINSDLFFEYKLLHVLSCFSKNANIKYSMIITIFQYNIVWANKSSNFAIVEKELSLLSSTTDVVVLPEMFSTGFCVDQLALAEAMDGATVAQLKLWAQRFDLAIAGSFIACENGKYFNRAFFVQPDGKLQYADKRHLFSMAHEHKYFSAGNSRLIVNYKGVKLCLLVCYDLRFPVWARNTHNAYDVLMFVANFPTKRIADWDVLLRARAIENQAYVVGVNRVGVDANKIDYIGHSVVLDYQGNALTQVPDNVQAAASAYIDLPKLETYRQRFAVWRDADHFEIEL